jgi:tetratricopeptide (TPR) repeat protein
MAEELRRLDAPSHAPRERIEAVFEFMHRRILRGGYDLTYTDLRRVLDEGRYNCVSATVLLNYLASEIGLECRGLEMPGHAMSRAVLPGGTFDIENTCPRWFRLDERLRQAEETQAAGAQNGPRLQADRMEYEKACRGDRSKAREVSAIQLAAMIYYNLGVDLLNAKHFAEAASSNAKAVRLDPKNATARGNLLATINNWSIELSNGKQFAQAVDLLRQGLAISAKFEPFAQNYVHIHRQWVEHLCGERRFSEAIEILSRATAEMPDRDYLRKAQKEVRQRWEKAVAASPAD